MTTLSGQASKGEKGRTKFQSLNVNSLITQSRGESLETHQQKNTLPRRHGMQILGKVPNTRRAPANLPSLKSENSGSDAAVSLVPTGGPGWGKQESPSSASGPSATTPTTSSPSGGVSATATSVPGLQPNCLPAGASPPAANVNASKPAATVSGALSSQMTMGGLHHVSPVAASDKSWSAVMGGGGEPHPPPYQSAQFQHEFPSLAGESGVVVPPPVGGTPSGSLKVVGPPSSNDTQYGPGPNLRPQTDASWMHGGSRAVTAAAPAATTPNGTTNQGSESGLGVLPPTGPVPGPLGLGKGNSGPLPGPLPLLGPAGLHVPPTGVSGSGTGTAGGVTLSAATTPTSTPPALPSTASNHLMPQFRGVIPSFLYRGTSNGHGLSNFQAMTNPLAGRTRFPPQPYSEARQTPRPQPPPDLDEVTPRPIIKEEDLNRMDDMTRDVGWASHDDIDYNQKLAFSDDESPMERDCRKEPPKKDMEKVDNEQRTGLQGARSWSGGRTNSGPHSQPVTPQTRAHAARMSEDDEYWKHKSRELKDTVANAVELAKLRKEEEEKRFMASKEAAKKKSQKVEDKSRKKEDEGLGSGGIAGPMTSGSMPEWDKERDTRERERSHTPNETADVKSPPPPPLLHRESDFRQMTQIEGRNFISKSARTAEREISREREGRDRDRDRERDRDRDRDRDRNDIRERDAPNFSRTFQSNLPPRFQKQQAERQSGGTPVYHKGNNASSPQPQPTTASSFAQQYDPRWLPTNAPYANKGGGGGGVTGSLTRKGRLDGPDAGYEREEERSARRDRHTPDDMRHRDRNYSDGPRKICSGTGSGGNSSGGGGIDSRYYDYDRSYRRDNSERGRDDDAKWEAGSRDRHYEEQRKDDDKRTQVQQDPFDEAGCDWHRDKYGKEWDERAADRHRDECGPRPESRDSRASKDRDSDYTSNWADSPFEPAFKDDKKKDCYREERRQVPGPITKEKIEADDLKNEKRHLTQLKRTSLSASGGADKSEKKLEDCNKNDKKVAEVDAWLVRKKEPTLEPCSSPKAWTESISPTSAPPPAPPPDNVLDNNTKKTSSGDLLHKSDFKMDIKKVEKEGIDSTKDKEEKGMGGRARSEPKGHRSTWSCNYGVYHASNWQKRGAENRGGRSTQRHRRPQSSRDWHGSDSELSADEVSVSTESGKEDRPGRHSRSQRSPKSSKKIDKDDKNKDVKQDKLKYDKRYEQSARIMRDSYIPRGEPSRHGRGGGGGGGFRGPRSIAVKRIDAYVTPTQPQPPKSPFGGQHDDKDKKLSSDEIGAEVISSDEKTKVSQQCGATSGIGSSRGQSKPETQAKVSSRKSDGGSEKRDRSKGRAHSGSSRHKSKSIKPLSSDVGDECWETTSDNSDTENERKDKNRKKNVVVVMRAGSANGQNFPQTGMTRQSVANAPGGTCTITTANTNVTASVSAAVAPLHQRIAGTSNRLASDKRSNSGRNEPAQRSSATNIRVCGNGASKSICKDVSASNDHKGESNTGAADMSVKKETKQDVNDVNKADDGNHSDDKNVGHFDADGFQEVRSKKNVKDRQKLEEKVSNRSAPKLEKEVVVSRSNKGKGTSQTMQLTPQQIANIPPLLGKPVNPPVSLSTTTSKSSFERPRAKLAPRFAKQRENSRLQKAQLQQGTICDVAEMNKINQSMTLYSMKEGSSSGSTNASTAGGSIGNLVGGGNGGSVGGSGGSSSAAPAPIPVSNAWDKPITSQLRSNVDQDGLLAMSVENCAEIEHAHQSSTSSQRSSPSTDKMLAKGGPGQDKALLDGTTPPVKTIIFENTNYKSTPVNTSGDIAVKSKFNSHMKNQRDKSRGNKLDETEVETSMISNFNKPMSDILNKGESKTEPIQMPLSFNKAEDNADMKLDFTFDPDLSQLTEDKGSKNLGLPRSIHGISNAQNTTMSPSTAELNLKIASVKKVWESMPTVLEHTVGGGEDNVTSTASFSTSFGPEPGTLDHGGAFTKGTDTPDDSHEGYSPSPNQSCTSNNTTNVCKVGSVARRRPPPVQPLLAQVKPTQQLAGAGQAVHAVSAHHGASQQHATGAGVGVGVAAGAGQHSTMVGQNLISHPLSPPPPPIQQMLGQPPQQYTSNQHINYQPSLGGSAAQYGSISAIPSPPTVLFNSTQQMPTQGGLYGHFQIDQSQVLNTQGRSQFSQYPNPYGLGQTASSPYSAQSMYLQTAPPHPPPSAQPPPDLYQSLSSQYRMAATGPFGQSQQLANNPSTVLISSTSNSLMSASVKPSSQQISAIGTKAGAVGQAYQQQSQQGQQLYIPYDPTLQANYLSNPGVLQRGPTGPVQNSVVPGLQPSSSYYSGSGAQTGFFQQPANSSMQSAQLHQGSYGLQGSVFGTHNQSHASAASLQSFGSQFLSSPMQMALTAQQQQYRSPTLPTPTYMKGVGTQHIGDQTGRSQQLKSPGANQQDVLASVFNSAPQISSPKSRQNCKPPPPQSSPTQHKYVTAYPTVNSQQSAQIPAPRYPTPIQRPVTFQPSLNSSLQGSGSVPNQRHRPTHNQSARSSQRQYYAQGPGIASTQTDKVDDTKLSENGTSVNMSSVSNAAMSKSSAAATAVVTQPPDLAKDAIAKDEAIIKE